MWMVAPVDMVEAEGDSGSPGWVWPPVPGQQAVRTDQVGPVGRSWHLEPEQVGPSPQGPMGGTGRALQVSQHPLPMPLNLLTGRRPGPQEQGCAQGHMQVRAPQGPWVLGQGLGRASPGAMDCGSFGSFIHDHQKGLV